MVTVQSMQSLGNGKIVDSTVLMDSLSLLYSQRDDILSGSHMRANSRARGYQNRKSSTFRPCQVELIMSTFSDESAYNHVETKRLITEHFCLFFFAKKVDACYT